MVMLTEIDNAEFVKQWHEGVPTRIMADHFGCSQGKVSTWARRLGLKVRRETVKPEVEAENEPQKKALPACPDLLPTPTWTKRRDKAIWEVQGDYTKMSVLAGRWDVPMASVNARWLLLRGRVPK